MSEEPQKNEPADKHQQNELARRSPKSRLKNQKQHTITTYVDHDIHEGIRAISLVAGMNVNDYVLSVLEAANKESIDSHQPKDPNLKVKFTKDQQSIAIYVDDKLNTAIEKFSKAAGLKVRFYVEKLLVKDVKAKQAEAEEGKKHLETAKGDIIYARHLFRKTLRDEKSQSTSGQNQR